MTMRYFPINLDIQGKPVTVIGGGDVALRKCLRLVAAGARTTVIAPAADPGLQALAASGQISHLEREYAPGDLAGSVLVFAVTDDAATNRAVAEEARQRAIPADIADAPELGSFTSPAVVSRGELLLTVSTGGRAPALARTIRQELETLFGPEHAAVVDLLGRVREKLLTGKGDSAYNKRILNSLAGQDLPTLFSKNAFAEIDHLLLSHCGPGFTMAELGVREKDSA